MIHTLPPTPWSADDVAVFDANERIIGYSGLPSSGASPALMLLWAAAPETKRQRDALIEALSAMVDRWEPDTEGTDRVMWENACAIIAECEQGDDG